MKRLGLCLVALFALFAISSCQDATEIAPDCSEDGEGSGCLTSSVQDVTPSEVLAEVEGDDGKEDPVVESEGSGEVSEADTKTNVVEGSEVIGAEGSGDSPSPSGSSDDVTPSTEPEESKLDKDEGSGGSEPSNVTCAGSEFGCCPDNVTVATSVDQANCDEVDLELEVIEDKNCTDTKFGCCADNSTMAKGAEGEGCPCHLLTHGCCPDNKTPAKGEKYYGCSCDHYPNGCCQDKYTPARGANFDGCVCDKMLYGCCQDMSTPASGPDMKGCGCENSAFGCCQDNRTAARGSGFEGCPCEATPHGCCPDRSTVSKGPEFEGCPCDTLPWGCCPNTNKPATGAKYAGCSCVDTPHGCCQDGVSVAYGPKFESCPDGPPLDTMLAAEACALPKERGPCRNYTVKWYYDMAYGGCTRFWYGGCDGNGNRFNSQEECERICVAPEGAEACSLPKVQGPCEGDYVSWYYAKTNRRCEQFRYGGCLGNKNRFDTRTDCEELCMDRDSSDPCEQPLIVGPCRGAHSRFYYSRQEGRCKAFVYGGCRGNENNFETERKCMQSCGSLTPREICHLPRAAGPCLGNYPRWHYDYIDGHCKEFTYTGCEGNRNRFVDKNTCEKTCSMTRVQVPTDICSLDKVEGPCRRNMVRWYFSRDSQRCERFYFGGCEGNANNFEEREDCERSCVARTPEQNVCALPREMGSCFTYAERWHFEPSDRKCHRFYYSGCGGNGNNFASREECEGRCGEPSTPAPTLSQWGDGGGSGGSTAVDRPVVHPDSSTGLDVHSGHTTEDCSLHYDQGQCTNYERKWFYDRRDGVCKEFYYGGCEGNGNRYSTRTDCETKCWNSQDICQLQVVRGPCSGNFTQWYYDPTSNECSTFSYSGCQGNANRFSGRETCENQCRRRSELDNVLFTGERDNEQPVDYGRQPDYGRPAEEACTLYPEQGPCKAYHPKYYFRSQDNSCVQFIYGGCSGNANRFETRKECEGRCLARSQARPEEEPSESDSKKEVCLLEVEAGPCGESHARWFYEPSSFTCLPFVYGGCGGNKNRFKSSEVCNRFCAGVKYEYRRPEERPPVPTDNEKSSVPGAPPVECPPPPNCEEQRCPFGIDNYQDENGCPTCRCSNPCYVHECPSGQRCAIEVFRGPDNRPLAQPLCRSENKPGQCPALESLSDEDKECVTRCRSDADCRDADKCCENGCAQVCLAPTREQSVPEEAKAAEEEIVVRAGYEVTLNCDTTPHFGRHVCWVRDGDGVCYRDPENRNVQVANGSLLFRQARREDAGQWACRLEEGADSKVAKTWRLVVHEPARINPGPKEIVAKVEAPAFFQCNAVGFPDPSVSWWRGFTMLPVSSIRYQQFANFTLMIRRVGETDAGVYSCRAYNGVGDVSVWEVALQIDFEPVMKPWESGVGHGGGSGDPYPPYNVPYDPNAVVTAATTTRTPIVPIAVEVRVASPEYRTGSSLQLDCVARGAPPPDRVYWTMGPNPATAPMVTDNHRYIMANNSLLIAQLTRGDSGEYRCVAGNMYNNASSSVSISVEDTFIPHGCNDSPYFANCELIVKGNYCDNNIYAKYCCKSCFLRGQLDRNQVNAVVQGHTPQRRRRVAAAIQSAQRFLARN